MIISTLMYKIYFTILFIFLSSYNQIGDIGATVIAENLIYLNNLDNMNESKLDNKWNKL